MATAFAQHLRNTMNFQSLQISLTKDHPQYPEVLEFYRKNIEGIFKTTLSLATDTAIASSEEEASDMCDYGCDSVVVFGEKETSWMGVEGIIAETFIASGVALPEDEKVREAFLDSVSDGIVSDVLQLIGAAFIAMDELSEE